MLLAPLAAAREVDPTWFSAEYCRVITSTRLQGGHQGCLRRNGQSCIECDGTDLQY